MSITNPGRVVEDQEDSDYGGGATIWWYLCEEHQSNVMGEVRDTEPEAEADLSGHRARAHNG